ncbi:MAG: hypothetical protein IPH55_06520 [Betaproteobacteria bacterium]|nr:hypothetical protein [Betaproteobacteria bacterium]
MPLLDGPGAAATAGTEGWFWKTAVEWRQEIGLTRREQETARCRLRALGLLEEKRAGMPAKRWFRIDVAALEQQLGPAPAAIDCGPHWIGADSALARRLGPPLVYWRRLREASGSVTAALYLSRALFWQRLALQQLKSQPEWFHRPIFQSQQILRFWSPATGARACPPAAKGVPRGAVGAGRAPAADDPPRSAGARPRAGGRWPYCDATRRNCAVSQAPARGPGSPHHSATGRPRGRAKPAKQQRPNPPTMAGATVRCT